MHYYRKIFFSAALILATASSVFAQETTIWELGKADQSSQEFALSPHGFKEFLAHDFGYEDNYFVVGQDVLNQGFPYILPGPANGWGGTGGTSGIRTHFLNLFYQLNSIDPKGKYVLELDFVNSEGKAKPTLQVGINGLLYNYDLKNGTGESNPVAGQLGAEKIRIDIDPAILKKGFNQLNLTSLKGGWIEFDSFRLLGPSNSKLLADFSTLIKGIETADIELQKDKERIQNLLLEVLRLKDNQTIKVLVDGKIVYQKSLDKGLSRIEIPLPAVKKSKASTVEVYVNDRLLTNEKLIRNPKPLGSFANYVNTMIGASHSRWMIAPGPWMPFSMVKLSPDNQNVGWQAGYEPSIESIGMFSHIHEWTMAGLGTFPTSGPLQIQVGDQYDPDSGYRSKKHL